MTHLAPIQFYSIVTTALPSKRLYLINLTSNKADAILDELKSCALETIYQDNQRMSGSISTLTVHTSQKQTELTRVGSVGSLRTHWP
ncbi:hypothetical protein TNCV_4198241 [Trichonephila clavipes]|nr:hypothetical protein TNCV_4198241 [Trichonephila clavipes]